jgi:hypothetical protein
VEILEVVSLVERRELWPKVLAVVAVKMQLVALVLLAEAVEQGLFFLLGVWVIQGVAVEVAAGILCLHKLLERKVAEMALLWTAPPQMVSGMELLVLTAQAAVQVVIQSTKAPDSPDLQQTATTVDLATLFFTVDDYEL